MSDERLPLTDHLEELRWRIIKSLIAIGIGFACSYAFSKEIFNFLVSPLIKVMPEDSHLIYTSLPEAFLTYLKVSFFAGIVVAIPVVFYQIWKFVIPGLFEKEKKYALPFVISASGFFLLGGFFAFYIVFPVGFKFFLGFSTDNIYALPTIREYLNLVTKLLLAFGLAFELPVVIFFLAKLGIVNHHTLSSKRKYAILIVVIMAAMLTPPDLISQILLALPLMALYEISIWIAYIVNR
ncbi:MAG: twin-arginine translocase subunit TatC [Deltaproteobacteria bacterium]|nr:twin-arginine translocase subunit TatC [Deltaproteobacteria bacterium]